MDEINKIPPVTRTMIFATLGVTLPGMLQIVSPYIFFLWWPAVYGKLQIWRPFTAFFYGGSGIQLLFDIFLLLRNSTDLETNKFYRKTADYAWALILVASLIVATNYPLKSPVLFNPLLMAIVYLWSRSNPHSSVSLFGLINCPAKYLPYAYLLFDLLRGGMPYAVQSATGLLSAHIYYFLKEVLPATNGGRGPNYLPNTPTLLRNLLRDSPDPNVQGQEAQQGGSVRSTSWGGTAFAPAGRSFGDGASGPTTGGQRLGSNSGGGLRSWLPFGSGNAGNPTTNSTGRTRSTAQTRPDREAMLAAAEARLQSLRENSIAGRNQAASAAASQAANSSEAKRRTSSSATASSSTTQNQAPFASAGSTLSGSQLGRTTARSQSGSEAIRRAAAGGSTMGGGNTTNRQGKAEEDQEETASGSGGRVAEIRRAPSTSENKREKNDEKEVGHSWGSGNRLGN